MSSGDIRKKPRLHRTNLTYLNGSKFIKMNRLSQWLLGVYEPEDFIADEETDESLLLIKRENLRSTFITQHSKNVLPPAWKNITGDSSGEEHPLSMLAEDETTKANLEATRLAIATKESTLQHSEVIVAETGTEINHSSIVNDTTLQQFDEPIATLTSAKGIKFLVPEAFLECYENIRRENQTLREKSQVDYAPVSSTKLEDDRPQQKQERVRLQDTYTCQYVPNPAHDGSSTPQVLPSNRTQPQLDIRDRAWRREGAFSRQNISENLGASGINDSSRRKRNLPIGDVGLTV